ncbi:hypothetical protein [Halosolutus gelatinilyticus]|uniref:hypothetical protein n=1 Tax=Halosolutus gelatinilyticus TaxID=2931975 RepID=UPI001FF13C53|nr:hypothetical protein [Halosolutus gelatinilyticus]
MSDSPLLVAPPDLARTYSGRAYSDPWDAVEDYQRVLEYSGRRPNAGGQAIASALSLPRGRVRPWLDGSIPRPVQGIQTAESHGWLPLSEDNEHFETINRLVAWVCSLGTIKPNLFTPYFRYRSDADRDRLEALLETLGLEPQPFRTDSGPRSAEISISEDGAVFGRLLVCLEAPTDDETIDIAPQYLNDVSKAAQSDFARVYVQNRAEHWEWNDRYVIEHANRSDRYRRSLATFFATLGADADVHEDAISIDRWFVEQLNTGSVNAV